MRQHSEWFDKWFDTPYYDILYRDRDQTEARIFLENLIAYCHLTPEHKLLDLACGKGRHAIFLNQKGFDVTGIDLSEKNITYARQFANNRLTFAVHDMRTVYREKAFEVVLNMFTSFGYFHTQEENESVVIGAAKALKPGGFFVIDFLNPYRVINHLVMREVKALEGINFEIERSLTPDGVIVKDIRFEDKGQSFHFQEQVKAIRQIEFLDYFRKAGLKLQDTFGDYQLNPYEQDKSERMIFITKK